MVQTTDTHPTSLEHRAIEDFVIRSWATIDYEAGVGAESQFTESGEFVTPALALRGRSDIARGFATRTSGSARTSRHLVSNLVVNASPDAVAVRYILTVFAANGAAPLPLDGVSSVCDVHDDLVAVDGAWQIRRRELVPVFVARDNDSVMLRGVLS